MQAMTKYEENNKRWKTLTITEKQEKRREEKRKEKRREEKRREEMRRDEKR